MLYHADKQKLLIAAAELLYTVDKVISSQKVAKLIVYFGKLFDVVKVQRPKYLQGSLFALGGLLKIEAKSYLRMMQEMRSDIDFELTCPLFNE